MHPRTLLRSAPARYAIAFSALSTLVMGSLLLVVYWSMVSLLERHLEQTIEQQFQILRDDIEQHGREAMIAFVAQQADQQRYEPIYFLVQDASGTRLAGDLPVAQAFEGWRDIPAPARLGTSTLLRARAEHLDDDTFVMVAYDTKDLAESRELILRSFGIALAATVLLTLSGGLIISAALLRRVDDISTTAGAIMRGDLSQRIPVAGSGDEIDRLAAGLNRMLARIEELMVNLQHTTSDIAHDLRTPLGRLRQRLEGSRIRARSAAEYETAIDAAIDDADTILKTFEAMLRIAQIEAGARRARFDDIDLSAVADNVVEAFTAVAEDEGRRIEAHIAPGVPVHGDRELLTQLLANLIENALGHTPRGTTVDVSLTSEHSGICLAVRDDGPGIPPAEREHVLQRFYRLDASRSTPGSGLGLSLVAAIARLHEADVVLADNHPGLAVSVSFTASPTVLHGASAEPRAAARSVSVPP